MTFVVINIFCLRINLNADTLFPFRYTNSIQSGAPFLLIVQPGSRIFPEWLYSFVAYNFTKEPLAWSRVVIAINITMLMVSLHYLFSKLGYKKNQRTLWLVVVMLIIPVFYLPHINVLIYFVFSPGIHGFYIPYMFLILGMSYQFIRDEPISKSMIAFMFILGVLLVFSNVNFVVMALAPISAISIFMIVVGGYGIKQCCQVVGFTSLITVTGIVMAKLLPDLFDSIYLSENNIVFFKIGLLDWLQNNSLFNDLKNRKISGYLLEATYLSIISSFWVVFIKKQKFTPAYYLNAFFIFSVLVFFVVVWVLDKGVIRLMPQVILLSPFILVYNLISGYVAKQKSTLVLSLTLAYIIIGGVSTYIFYSENRPYIQHNFIHNQIKLLKKRNVIKGDGLANYWIAHTNYNPDTTILPVTYTLQPYLFASNAKLFWKFKSKEIPTKRLISYVINDKRRKTKKWSISEKAIIKNFGMYDQIIDYQFKGRFYKLYIYSDGINTTKIYELLIDNLQM